LGVIAREFLKLAVAEYAKLVSSAPEGAVTK
jgi:hypothetical protein